MSLLYITRMTVEKASVKDTTGEKIYFIDETTTHKQLNYQYFSVFTLNYPTSLHPFYQY